MARLTSQEDTIAALATSAAEGAIGIIRLSGARSIEIVESIFLSSRKKPLSGLKSFSMCYGWIVRDKAEMSEVSLRGEDFKKYVIDEVVVSLMRAPKSYTREDIVEINSHGGVRVLSSILEMVIVSGARLAEPGEFTKRAFLKGRIDLSQAEAVLDVIQAKSELALKNSMSQLTGDISRFIKDLRARIMGILAEMESTLDFSEEESVSVESGLFVDQLSQICAEVDVLIERGFKGRLIREGLKVAIFGRPNVGKSSLLNAILKQERAIVTPIPGTTRDTIEEFVNIKGLALHLIDTAGILQHRDEIERQAVDRSHKAASSADLVLFVLDGSVPLTDEDRRLAGFIKDVEVIAVVNKADLPLKIDEDAVEQLFLRKPVRVCSFNAQDIMGLEDKIFNLFFQGEATRFLQEGVMVSNVRHIEILSSSRQHLQNALNSLRQGFSMDFVAFDVRKTVDILGELTGEVFTEDLLDVIFSKFCIGK